MFDHARGFGFAKRDDGQGDAFIHVSEVIGGDIGLGPGDRVAFEMGVNKRNGKPQAVGVRLIKDQQEEAA
jgi:cold shock protein